MNKKSKPEKRKVGKWLYWSPRIISILFILFLFMFSFDVFEGNSGFWNIAFAFFMHNIPVLILTAVLIISWKYEIVGAIGFILGGFVYIGFILSNIIRDSFQWYYLAWAVQIAGPAFVVGILWWLNWKRKKR